MDVQFTKATIDAIFKTERFRLVRVHITEDAAQSLLQADVEAIMKAFPDAIVEKKEATMFERYAPEGLIACIVDLTIDTDKAPRPALAGWLRQLENAKYIEGNPLRVR